MSPSNKGSPRNWGREGDGTIGGAAGSLARQIEDVEHGTRPDVLEPRC